MPTEDFVPYHRSTLWAQHDAYFQQRGIAAWSNGDIPHYATNNPVFALQYARFLRDAFRDSSGPVTLLEVGSGAGGFVSNLLRALQTACGTEGTLLLDRLRYVMSDVSALTLRQAIEREPLRTFVQRGLILPALVDLHRPEAPLVDLDGSRIDGRFDVVVANYVVCVSRTRIVSRLEDRWRELCVRTEHADTGKPSIVYGWQPMALSESIHSRLIQACLNTDGALSYPEGFVEYLLHLPSQLKPGGVLLISDYGGERLIDHSNDNAPLPRFFGQSLNHAVHFPLLDHLQVETGWSGARTTGSLRPLHHAMLSPSKPDRAAMAAFQEHFVICDDASVLLDLRAAARALVADGQSLRAVRLYLHCLKMAPDNPETFYRIGGAALEAGRPALAVEYLSRCEGRPEVASLDWAFELGRALSMCGNDDAALDAYTRSLSQDNSAITHGNIALLHLQNERLDEACQAAARGLTVEPENERLKTIVKALKERLWEERLRS